MNRVQIGFLGTTFQYVALAKCRLFAEGFRVGFFVGTEYMERLAGWFPEHDKETMLLSRSVTRPVR